MGISRIVAVPTRPLQRIPPHAVRRDVLSVDEHAALLAWTLANEAALEPAQVSGARIDPSVRNARHYVGDAPWKPVISERIGTLMPGLIEELGMIPFAIHGYEIELVAYPDGGFINGHVDTATRATRHAFDRVLSAVYYFHREPKPYEGGALRLMPARMPPPDAPRHIDIAPIQNGVVAFPSWAPHEVLRVSSPSGDYADSRFAVNCWALKPRE